MSRSPSLRITDVLSITLIQKRIGHSVPGIWKFIRAKKIQPAVIVGKLKLYTPEQADFIGRMMRPYNYKAVSK